MTEYTSYTDIQGWCHEYYKSPNGTHEYVCKRGGVAITNIKNFVIIKCSPRSIIEKIDWLLDELANAENNNADIKMSCDVYIGEYIRVDICTDDGCYNVFNERNMILFSGVLANALIKKLNTLLV